MYHSQYEVFIYNVGNCQLLVYFHYIEDVRNCQEEELYQGTSHGKAVDWVDAAVSMHCWELLWGSHRLGGTTAPRVGLSTTSSTQHELGAAQMRKKQN